MSVARYLEQSAKVFPNAPAIYLGKTLQADYGTLRQRASIVGGYLKNELGLVPGDRVAIFMTNAPEYLEIMYGAWFAGLIVAPINCKLHTNELLAILKDMNASVLFVSDDLAHVAQAVSNTGCGLKIIISPSEDYLRINDAKPLHTAYQSDPNDVAWLFYTSGTTGRSKGVMLSHRNLIAMTAAFFSDVEPAHSNVPVAYTAPLSHAAGLWNFAHMHVAAPHIIPASRGFDPAELLEIGHHFGRVSLFAVPTMVKRLVDHIESSAADPSCFQTILYAGGPMYLEDICRALRVMGNKFVQIYGQGETPMTITALTRRHLADRGHPRHLNRIASVGIPHSIVDVVVADKAGNPAPTGEQGEILVRGDTVMVGYWNSPEATAATVKNDWLQTGDVGVFDEDGFLTLTDRTKDVIISGGSNIYPREVEEVLLKHSYVHEAAVIGRRHDEWGEEVVAFITTNSNQPVSKTELDELCRQHVASYKRPRAYYFVDSLPKSSYGKVLKRELREIATARHLSSN